ncbi:universal stress protein [Haloarcula nitratireducens]|uniref:Universal stress protein n=1 Tax=Haloarcula nitratireducens TaxID=2487749 RepID=A0AAW4PE04_9EURY|nr:universal stress protein [Halomicroarcula nitratireducens]MBX0296139.1 universal stress protein [Halomicroarcula nitratireducens]
MKKQNGTLLVPVANPETVERLLDTAIDIARGQSMRVVVLHVVEVPPQIPLSAGDSLLEDDGEEVRLLDEAVEQATDADVAVESRMRYARDVATGIVGAADVHDADALLVGWRGRPRRRNIILGSFLDRILGEAPCDVFVKRIRTPSRDVDSILVPVAGGSHCELAVELAGTIASQRDAVVHLLHVTHPDADESTQEDTSALLQNYGSSLSERDVKTESTTLQSDHVAGAITDETANHDLTVLGATRDPFLKRKLVGSVAEGVGRAAASSTILTRKARQTKTPDDSLESLKP